MGYKMFIDDERFPVTDDWVIVRSSAEAIDYVQQHGMPQEISFDHDLGGDDTSRVFIKWLIDAFCRQAVSFPVGFTFSVHSQNPIGAEWINSTINSLQRHFPNGRT